MQEVSGQTGYAGQNSLNVEFGLKKASRVDSIQIRWPSGAVNGYADVAVNRFLTLRENNRPRMIRSLDHINLSQVGADSAIDLNAAPPLFEDLDHDRLTYFAASNNDQIATASVSGSALTVLLVSDKSAGRCRITVSADDGLADDGRGNVAETSFEINRPPIVIAPIPDLVLGPHDSSRFVADLAEVFADPDGDALKYTLSNSDSTVAVIAIRSTSLVASVRDSQNFPNPFNPATTIRYGLPQAGHVSMKIYSLLGEEVVTLVNDEHKAAGYHLAIWDGRDKSSNSAASGVYVCRIHAGNFAETRKMILVR